MHWMRGLGFWSIRNAAVATCIVNGQKHVNSFLSDEFKNRHSILTGALQTFVPGLAAAVCSHPADLMTGLLNGDPKRYQFRNGWVAFQQLVKTHGARGLLVASPARFMVFTIDCNLFPWMFQHISQRLT